MPKPAEAKSLAPGPIAPVWKHLFEASSDAQLICDAQGRVECLNPKAAWLFGFPSAEVPRGFSLFDALAPPVDAKLKESLARSQCRPERFPAVTLVFAEPGRGPVDLELAPLPECRALLLFRDAGPRLRLESQVRRLVTAIDSAPEVFFITDADFRITFVNPAFQRITGYNIEEVLGRADLFLRAPSEQDKVKLYLGSITRGREWSGKLTNVRRDGTVYSVQATCTPIFDPPGRFIGYVACERENSPRADLQAALELERGFARGVLASLEGAVYAVDREFCLMHSNEAWRRLPPSHGGFCFDAPPRRGEPLLEFVPDAARRAELNILFLEVLQTGALRENRFAGHDGRYWLVRISPWFHADEICGLICTITDQTHYHELQDQLFQSQKMEIIGALAAGVAHDFNNLLHAIRGNVGLVLLQTPEDSNLRHWAEQISVAVSRAADITQQLLSFSRDSAEKDTVVDLNEVIQEAGRLAGRTLRANIRMEIQCAPDPVGVKVDPTRASQVLLNLCVNAQDAMPQGGRLTLSNSVLFLSAEQATFHGVGTAREFARCSVSDTGSGISPQIAQRIFEPFFTTKEKGKGTGLGLSIVRRVVRDAGGFLEFDTQVGRGTTFHLYFPLAHEAPVTAAPPARGPLPQAFGRVLVVDDLDLLRDFTKNFLETAGLEVLVANDGNEALQILEKASDTVDLLFTDYAMPGMDGVELVERVAARWPQIRLVLTSGYLDEAAQRKLSHMDISVLTKPYEMEVAAELIHRLLAPKAAPAG